MKINFTDEQKAIIESHGDIKINAVAGSGKTTTLIEYARGRPGNSKILYLAFNKSVRLEAQKRFVAEGLAGVTVETAHSLAYKRIVYRHGYRLKNNGYKTHEIVALLGLNSQGEKHGQYVVASHINKFISYFCNSPAEKIRDINYADVVADEKARAFVERFYGYIEKQTRLLLAKMNRGEIEIPHDFYLKKFQLSRPELPYDYILFDEGQDASPAMLDVFLRQKATKVIVGDSHQQIYGWRHAINSLEKTDFATLPLTNSFRFGPEIAFLARGILDWKSHIRDHTPVKISGRGRSRATRTKAILARGNLGLLVRAIDYITEHRQTGGLYFEGNINSYTYADDGASLYDILNLYNGNRARIRDKLISEMKGLDDLEEYVKKTDDVQLGLMIDIVREYGNEIPGILARIKEKHVADGDKDKADVIFSTVHRCKGMEYDTVELVNDFISESRIKKLLADTSKSIDPARLIEEVNILYVAVTRTRHLLSIPESLLPEVYPRSDAIRVIAKSLTDKKDKRKNIYGEKKEQHRTVRERRRGAYQRWTKEQDMELTVMHRTGKSMAEMAQRLERTKGAIWSRIQKLGLEEW